MAAGIEKDFTVYPFSKTIRHNSGTTEVTVHTVQEFYSFLMNLFDEPGYMSYEKPMKYNTPTSYTMLNGWFIDNGDESEALKYLQGGSIDTSGYGTGSDNEVVMIDCDATTDWVDLDHDKAIQYGGATTLGPLLAYKNDYPIAGTARIWCRNTSENALPAENIAIATLETGTGAGTTTEDIVSGNETYTNLYTIASFAGTPDPQVYIRQKHPVNTTENPSTYVRIEEWSTLGGWDPGSIDVIIPVKLGGALIDSGLVNAYVRQTGDTFTHVENIDLSAGSRTPIATESSADEVNITTGENYMLYDTATAGTGDFAVGDFIQQAKSDESVKPTWHAEIVAVSEYTTGAGTGTGLLTLRAVSGTPADSETIFVANVASAATVGTIGDTLISHTGAGTEPVGGDLGKPFEGSTSGGSRVLTAYDNVENVLVMEVYNTHGTLDSQDYTGAGRNTLYTAMSSGEVLDAPAAGTGAMSVTTDSVSTTLTAGFSDVTIAHVNGTVDYDTKSADFTIGERVTWNAGADSAIVVADDTLFAAGTTGNLTLANVTSDPVDPDTITGDISGSTCEVDTGGFTDAYKAGFEFNLQTTGAEYAVFIEGGSIYAAGRSFDEIYAYNQYRCRDGETTAFITSTGSAYTSEEGQFYIRAFSSYAATKVAPFGTLAGGVFFGAQGVWVQGMASSDNNNLKLTDNLGALQQPFVSITLTISNTRADDVIAIFLEDGSTGLPDKAQYTGNATSNVLGGGTVTQDAAGNGFPNDTPLTGAVYIVATDEKEEHKYRYTSWANDGGDGNDGQLTLAANVAGIAEGGTVGQTLFDTGVFASGVEKGDIINRTSGSNEWCYVISVDNANQVTTTVLSDGTDWAVSDAFKCNSLVQTYDASDTFFIPYLEAIEATGTDITPGEETEDLTYVADRSIIIRVRNSENSLYYIQPFITPGDITTTGLTQSVIRTEDTVYS